MIRDSLLLYDRQVSCFGVPDRVRHRLSPLQTRHGLLQLGVLGFGFFEDGDIGVGVLPKRQEIFVSS